MRTYAPIMRTGGLDRADYEVVAIIREPISWLSSWYRYRQDERFSKQAGISTRDLSFAEFLEAYLEGAHSAYAKIGSPARFVSDKNGQVGVDRLFRYDDLDRFFRFASNRFRTNIVAPMLNVSPSMECDVPPQLLLRVREKLAPAFELYESIGANNDFRPRLRAGNKNDGKNRKNLDRKATMQAFEARPS
ncbi:MAG TPA: hypothetical protein VFE13_18780 [Caulobacteraceae bacterium]|nr:hypothetical protein [Caulobacteraceae bacterium]